MNKALNIEMSLAEKIETVISGFQGVFNLQMLYQFFPDQKETTIRGRVYRELLGKGVITKEGKGFYSFKGTGGEEGLILNGDARTLDCLEENSIDLIIADHPYPIQKGNNRACNSTYSETTFRYTLEDFSNKSRVLKDGSFLVEFLPELKETNMDYLAGILLNAKEAGFNFYCKVPWYKAEIRNGKLVDGSAFVGRKAVLEEIYIFSKGSPRRLRTRKQGKTERTEKGARSMLPAIFMEPTIIPSKRSHQAQKPQELLKKLIEALSLETEVVLDQFAGSFATFWAAIALNRKAIAIEVSEEFVLAQTELRNIA